MLSRPGVTQNLARFVVETKWEDIPERARHEAKRALLNFFAVAIAGCRTEPVELALRTLAEYSGGKQATIIGRTERIDALGAAFLNAAGANVFDYCDTHLPTVVHPTAPLAPALLSLAELRRGHGAGFHLAMPAERRFDFAELDPRASNLDLEIDPSCIFERTVRTAPGQVPGAVQTLSHTGRRRHARPRPQSRQ